MVSKGRTEIEAKTRKNTQQWAICIKSSEEEFCDYIISNNHDPKTNRWEKGKKELLGEFNRILQEFKCKEQDREKFLNQMFPKTEDLMKYRRYYLQYRWSTGDPTGCYWIYNQINGKNLTYLTLRNLYREFKLQRWLDELLFLSPVYHKVGIELNNSRHKGVPENDMERRDKLAEEFNKKREKLGICDNLTINRYNALVSIVPLFDGETINDRIKLLRSPYINPKGPLYCEDEKRLNKMLIEISSPDEYSV